jgi:hypothetical protein
MSRQTCDWSPAGLGYVCRNCKASSDVPRQQICGHAPAVAGTVNQAALSLANSLACPHRGPAIATVNARVAGCGCASSTVEVYECQLFAEPVLKQSPSRCTAAVAASVPTYTGRTCRECIAVAQSTRQN